MTLVGGSNRSKACEANEELLAFVVNLVDPACFDIDLTPYGTVSTLPLPKGKRSSYTYEEVVLDLDSEEVGAKAIGTREVAWREQTTTHSGYTTHCFLKGIELLAHVDNGDLYHEILNLLDLSEGWVKVTALEEQGDKIYVSIKDLRSEQDIADMIRKRFPGLLRSRSPVV